MQYLVDLDNTLLKTFTVKEDGRKVFFWSKNLKKDLNINPDTLPMLFDCEFMQLLQRRIDVEPIVEKYLQTIGSSVTAADFLRYWLENNSLLNFEVWNWIKYRKSKGDVFHIASDQTILRMNYLWRRFTEWQYVFDKVFTSAKFNVVYKEDEAFFRLILAELNEKPQNICLIDDDVVNINSAAKVGINTILFHNVEDLKIRL